VILLKIASACTTIQSDFTETLIPARKARQGVFNLISV
jgi:hypothetical protein